MAPPQRISFEPDPPQAGASLVICYDFSGLQQTSTTMQATFTPPVVSPATYTVTPEENCITILVPESESVTLEDLDGPSPDKTAAIDP